MANAKTGTVLSPSLLESWERAKLAWSKFTRLQDPLVLSDIDEIIEHQMQGVMAQIEMADLRVILNMISITQLKLEDLLDVIMAHEVGHHVLAPGSLLNHVRLVSVISGILSGGQREFMVNIFTDLLVNDFLFTQRHMKVNEIYIILKKRYEEASMEFGEDSGDAFWALYMRVYEILWRMPRGSMCNIGELTGEIERDAKLAARTLRTFSKKWFKCIKNLTYIFKGYLPEMTATWEKAFAPSFDKIKPGKDALDKVWGFSKMSEEEAMKPTEKTYDGSLSDIFKGNGSRGGQLPTQGESGRIRSPAEYIETLQYIGIIDDPTKALIQYYTELAFPSLIPFPKTEKFTTEPLVEGTDQWNISDGLATLDYMESLKESPILFPGVTTRKRRYGKTKGHDTRKEPIDIDIYIDTSGSMGAPSISISYPTVAAFILVLSALRAGASVQATSWSGDTQVISTNGFSKSKDEILSTILYFWGDGTLFPLSVFERYRNRQKEDPPVHIIIISDDGVDTMLQKYKDANGKLQDGIDIVKMAMEKGKAKGSLLLRLGPYTEKQQREKLNLLESIGFTYHKVLDMKDLVTFAKAFSRKHFT